MIEAELTVFADAEIVAFIRGLLITPKPVPHPWDYGPDGQEYVCWHVMEDPKVGTGIAFCEEGFGPRCPWGLIWLDQERNSMGPDSSWYTTFLDAFFESFSSSDLKIYHVTVAEIGGKLAPLDPNAPSVLFDEAYGEVEKLRIADPHRHYGVGTWQNASS